MELKEDQPAVSFLRTKRYGLFWLSSLLSNMGTWMQQVAQPWVILSMTQSSFWVGLDSFAMNAPSLVFTLWGGVLADRFNRKKIILFFQIIQFFCILSLLLLLVTGKVKIWMIVLISFLVGSTDALSMPAFQSIIPSLVSSKDIPRAVALNSTQFNLSRIIGPSIAGLVMGAFGATACFGANLISYLPFFLSVYWIYPNKVLKPAIKAAPAQPLETENEFRHLLRNPLYLTPLMTIFFTTIFCGPLITFCSVIIKTAFHAGARDLGWVTAAFGFGGVIGAILSSILISGIFASNKYPTIMALLLGLVTCLVAFASSLIILDGLIFLAGFTLTVINTSVNSNLQRMAGNHIRGRVISLYQLALHGGLSIGSLITGAMSNSLGIKMALFGNGIVTIVFQLCILLIFESNFRLHRKPTP